MSAILSSYRISDWRNVVIPADFTKPQLVNYFTVSYKYKNISQDINYLKYFDKKALLNTSSMYSTLENNLLRPIYTEKMGDVKEWILQQANCIKDNTKGIDIVTFPSVLSTIMCTPFELCGDRRNWKLTATFKDGKIFLINKNENDAHLCYNKSMINPGYGEPYTKQSYTNNSSTNVPNQKDAAKLSDPYELLKRYLFVRKPEKLHRKVISVLDMLFYEEYHLNIGCNKVLYLSETPGVCWEEKLNNVDELKTSNHVYCDVFSAGEFTQDLINFNPIWWTRAQLINAKRCSIGLFNKDQKILQEILNISLDKFDDTTNYENLWSPIAAWSFLEDVLTFIKEEIFKVDPILRKQQKWEFESFKNDQPFITMV